MNIHEYQGKEIFRSMGVAVPEGRVAFTAEKQWKRLKELDTEIYVVKAQIHWVEVKQVELRLLNHYLRLKLMPMNY